MKDAAEAAYGQIDAALTAAFSQVPLYPPARRLEADALADRLRIAERDLDPRGAERLANKLRLPDREQRYAALVAGEGALEVTSDPPGAALSLFRFDRGDDGRLVRKESKDGGFTPWRASLPLGSYVLEAIADGHERTTYPVLVGRGLQRTVHIVLPRAGSVPEGFRYVAGGPFLFGSPDEKAVEQQGYAPQHERTVGPFLVAVHEVTFAEWLEYYNAAPPGAERAARSLDGVLAEDAQGVYLDMGNAFGESQRLHVGERYDYGGRRVEDKHGDWTRWPVFNVDFAEAQAYARWLSERRKLAARLCNEVEWEKAARGADGRSYPHGNRLAPRDASTRLTDGADREQIRLLDEVGSYPASRSVYGVDDLVGNVAEWTDGTADTVPVRSSWWKDSGSLELWARTVQGKAHRGLDAGIRLCLTPSE
jgi:hypothetical protein